MTTTEAPYRAGVPINEAIDQALDGTGQSLAAWCKAHDLPYKYIDNIRRGRVPAGEGVIERIAAAIGLSQPETDTLILRCGIMPRHILDDATDDPLWFLDAVGVVD